MLSHELSLIVKYKELTNPQNVNFNDLLKICTKLFGNPRIQGSKDPRIRGSHHIFKTPWKGDPRINIQKDGKNAKPYQVKMVINAIKKLEEENGS